MGCGRVGYNQVPGQDASESAPLDARTGNAMDAAEPMADGPPAIIDARAPDAADPDGRTLAVGLIAWYPLEALVAGDNVADASGNGHTGACADGCPTVASGRIDSAFAFDEVATIRVPDNGAFQTTGGFTIAAWVYFDRLAYSAPLSKPLEQPDGIKDSWQFELDTDGSIAFTTASRQSHRVDYAEDVTISARTWVHLAGTFDGSIKRFYVDGQLQYELARDVDFDDADIIIGGDENDGGPALMFPGRVDDVRIYGRELSEQEVMALAAAP